MGISLSKLHFAFRIFNLLSIILGFQRTSTAIFIGLTILCSVGFFVKHKLKTKHETKSQIMDQVIQPFKTVMQFARESIHLVKLLRRRTNSNKTSFKKTATAILIGLTIICSIGFFVKLIHIPINNIIFGW